MDQVAQHVADTATKILLTEDEVSPMAFSLKEKEDEIDLVIVPILGWDTFENKVLRFRVSLGLARAFGTKRLLTVTDAWVSTQERDEVETTGFIQPSKNPNRTEALVITDSTELGVQGWMLPYTRDEEGTPVPSEWQEMGDQLDGMVVELMTEFTHYKDPTPEMVERFHGYAKIIGVDHESQY